MHHENNRLSSPYYYSPNPRRQPQLNPRPRRNTKFLVFMVVFVAIVLGIIILHSRFSHEADAIPQNETKSSNQTTIAKPLPKTTTDQQMAASINQIIAANPDVDVSVSMTDLTNNKTYHYGIGVQF